MTAYRDDVAALAARHEALASELADKTREVAEAADLLAEARTRAARPILDNIRVASPCPADWDQMVGDDRVRACASCQKNVYNLSELTRDEAEALIIEKEGKLCVQYYQRKDGTILLKDCSVGVARTRKRRLVAAGAATLLAGAGLFSAREVLGIGADARELDHSSYMPCQAEAPRMVKGEMAYEPPPPPAPVEPNIYMMGEGLEGEPEDRVVPIKGRMVLDIPLPQAKPGKPGKQTKPAKPARPSAK